MSQPWEGGGERFYQKFLSHRVADELLGGARTGATDGSRSPQESESLTIGENEYNERALTAFFNETTVTAQNSAMRGHRDSDSTRRGTRSHRPRCHHLSSRNDVFRWDFIPTALITIRPHRALAPIRLRAS